MITLVKQPKGLLIVLNDYDAFVDFLETVDKDTNVNGEGEVYIPHVEMYDLLEASQYLGNGWNDVTDHIGLTEAPAISDEACLNDSGQWEIDEFYYYADYMVSNWVECLLENKEVLFLKSE